MAIFPQRPLPTSLLALFGLDEQDPELMYPDLPAMGPKKPLLRKPPAIQPPAFQPKPMSDAPLDWQVVGYRDDGKPVRMPQLGGVTEHRNPTKMLKEDVYGVSQPTPSASDLYRQGGETFGGGPHPLSRLPPNFNLHADAEDWIKGVPQQAAAMAAADTAAPAAPKPALTQYGRIAWKLGQLPDPPSGHRHKTEGELTAEEIDSLNNAGLVGAAGASVLGGGAAVALGRMGRRAGIKAGLARQGVHVTTPPPPATVPPASPAARATANAVRSGIKTVSGAANTAMGPLKAGWEEFLDRLREHIGRKRGGPSVPPSTERPDLFGTGGMFGGAAPPVPPPAPGPQPTPTPTPAVEPEPHAPIATDLPGTSGAARATMERMSQQARMAKEVAGAQQRAAAAAEAGTRPSLRDLYIIHNYAGSQATQNIGGASQTPAPIQTAAAAPLQAAAVGRRESPQQALARAMRVTELNQSQARAGELTAREAAMAEALRSGGVEPKPYTPLDYLTRDMPRAGALEDVPISGSIATPTKTPSAQAIPELAEMHPAVAEGLGRMTGNQIIAANRQPQTPAMTQTAEEFAGRRQAMIDKLPSNLRGLARGWSDATVEKHLANTIDTATLAPEDKHIVDLARAGNSHAFSEEQRRRLHELGQVVRTESPRGGVGLGSEVRGPQGGGPGTDIRSVPGSPGVPGEPSAGNPAAAGAEGRGTVIGGLPDEVTARVGRPIPGTEPRQFPRTGPGGRGGFFGDIRAEMPSLMTGKEMPTRMPELSVPRSVRQTAGAAQLGLNRAGSLAAQHSNLIEMAAFAAPEIAHDPVGYAQGLAALGATPFQAYSHFAGKLGEKIAGALHPEEVARQKRSARIEAYKRSKAAADKAGYDVSGFTYDQWRDAAMKGLPQGEAPDFFGPGEPPETARAREFYKDLVAEKEQEEDYSRRSAEQRAKEQSEQAAFDERQRQRKAQAEAEATSATSFREAIAKARSNAAQQAASGQHEASRTAHNQWLDTDEGKAVLAEAWKKYPEDTTANLSAREAYVQEWKKKLEATRAYQKQQGVYKGSSNVRPPKMRDLVLAKLSA